METMDVTEVLWMMLSNTLKLKVLKLNHNILMKLFRNTVNIPPLVTSKLVDTKMLVDISEPQPLTSKKQLLLDLFLLLLMLKTGHLILEVSILLVIVEPNSIMVSWLLVILMIIGSLKTLGVNLGVKKVISD